MATIETDSTFTIEEKTGKKRRLDLFGSGMPRMGANWTSQLKKTTSWNPGNGREATQQVLVRAEMPTNLTGRWSTTNLIRSPANFYDGGSSANKIARANTLKKIVDDILSGGQRLVCTFVQATATGGERIVREGLADTWSFNVRNLDDIEWAIDFDWSGRGKQKTNVDLGGDKTLASLREANRVLSDYTSEVTGKKLVKSLGGDIVPTGDLLSALEQIASIPNDFTDQLQQEVVLITGKISKYAKLITGVAATPVQFVSSLANIATIAITTIGQTVDDMGTVMPDALSDLDGDAGALLTAADYFAVSQDGGERILGTMAEILAATRARASGLSTSTSNGQAQLTEEILAVYLSRQNDTFAGISLKFFQTADHASVIAGNNGFDESEIEPPVGTTLVIPVLNPVQLVLKV